jgi:hypothetical protein
MASKAGRLALVEPILALSDLSFLFDMFLYALDLHSAACPSSTATRLCCVFS